MKVVIVSVFLLALATSIRAQQDSLQVSIILSMPAYNATDIGEFHDYMSQNNYLVQDYWAWGVSAGLGLEYNRFNLDVVGTFNFNQKETLGDSTYSGHFGVIGMELSYAVFNSTKVRLHPFVGFRSTVYRYELKVEQTYSDLVDYLESPELNKEMQFRRNYLTIGVGLEFGQDARIGVRSGLYVPVNRGDWTMNGFTLSDNVPRIRSFWFAGLYLRIGGAKFVPRDIFK